MYWTPIIVLVVATIKHAQAQATANTAVAPELRECYMNATLLNRNNLPPATIDVLIDIIRKIEDHPDVNVDLRMLATLILHTYRQDGIQFYQQSGAVPTQSAYWIPFSPSFHSFHRHRLVLRLIPNNLQSLSNTTLPSTLKCALHHMLSTTVDARLRGDESTCSQLSQYRALRTSRSAQSVPEDVEILDLKYLGEDQNGHMHQYDPNSDVESASFGVGKSARVLTGESSCPILTGVVNTRWGAVSAGNLIAGIAAGAESQRVSVTELTKGLTLSYQNVATTITTIYPATLSGDLAEAVLIQGSRGRTDISIGSSGNWNSSQAPRYFMLSSRDNLQMMDPEIRGDIDGFLLGSTLRSTLGIFSSLKLSQLLDMYYSPRNGVFNPSLRACNRRESQQSINGENLETETQAFAAALDTTLPLEGTLIGGLQAFTSSAVRNFQTYASNNLNDLTCAVTEATFSDTRLRTNLYIVLDTTWPYQAIYPAISYLLDHIEVGKFGSSVTILSAFDGSVVINKTFSLADFHAEYTLEKHQSLLTGVNLETVYSNIRVMMQDELMNETAANYVGGNSSVLLFLLNSGNIQISDSVRENARIINETVPDLRVLYATSSNQIDNLWFLVRNMHEDIFTISLSSAGINVGIAMAPIFPIFTRIQSVGRRVINPTCGSNFDGGSSGTRQFDDFVEPGYINYYRISPNYFYSNNENRRVRITRTAASVGSLIICESRYVPLPRQNSTVADGNINCQTLTTTGNVEIGLQNPCNGFFTIGSCPPLFFSVQSNAPSGSASAVCTDLNLCRFPYNIRYQVQVEELGCFSSGTNVTASAVFLLLGFIVNILRNNQI